MGGVTVSIIHIRNAFNEAGGEKLVLTAARLRYGKKNVQILEFDGRYAQSGAPFRVVSEPFEATIPPQSKAREIAAQLLKDEEP